MDIENTSKKSVCILEIIKWFIISILLIVSIVGNYLYRSHGVLLRGMVIISIIFFVIYIVSTTKIGKLLIIFGKESRIELRQVVWPSYRDGLNTTLIVVVVTVVVSLILWGLDAVIVKIISFGLRL